MRNRLLAGGVAVAGVAVLIALLVGNLFGIAPNFEDLTDGFRPVMEDEALDTARADIAALSAVADEFAGDVVPQMAAALQMEPDQFGAFMSDRFPAVAVGVASLPQVAGQFSGVVALLEQQQENFGLADQIPTSSLPATTMPWILLAVTLGAVIVAIVMLRRARFGAMIALGFGVLVVAGVLALSFLDKAGAADDMNDALQPVYNQELVDGAAGALQIVGAMGQQMQSEMLPAVAEQLQLSAEELNGFLAGFPATAAALETLPETMGRFDAMVTTFGTHLGDYEAIQGTALTPIAWTLLLAGLAIVLIGSGAIVTQRREEVQPVRAPARVVEETV
jgi:hypothetical protein